MKRGREGERERGREGEREGGRERVREGKMETLFPNIPTVSISFVVSIQTKTGFGLLKISKVEN